MKRVEESIMTHENRILRKAIKNKYETYRLLDPSRFPAIELNTNRANYEPLRESFEEEFYAKRGINRLNNNLHIPSANTLSFIFSDDTYLPRRRILNTCQSYANMELEYESPKHAALGISQSSQQKTILRNVILIGSMILIAFLSYLILNYGTQKSPKSLILNCSIQNQTVPRLMVIEGTAPINDTVWIVAHPMGSVKKDVELKGWKEYYVQDPVPVDKSGKWKREIYMGRIGAEDIGIRFQIRAFIHPDKEYQLKESFDTHVFNSWPKAEFFTEILEVVRGQEVLE